MRRAIVIGPFFGARTGRNHNLEAFERARLALRESAGAFANIPHSSVPAGMPEPDQKRAMARHMLVHDAVVVMDGIEDGSFEEALVTLARGIGMRVVPVSELLEGSRAERGARPEPERDAPTTAQRLAARPIETSRSRPTAERAQGSRERGSAAGAARKRRPVVLDGKRYGSVTEAAEACDGTGAGIVNAIKGGRRYKGHEVAYDERRGS